MSVDGVHLEASLPSPASWGAVSLQIPLPWNLWFHTSLGASCSQVSLWIPLHLLSVVVVYPYGLYAVSRCLFRPRHYYPGLVSLSCSCASTSTPGISVHHPGVCCYGSTGPLHTSTGTCYGTPYLAYPGIGGGYPQDAISGHLGGGMSGYPSQDTL